MSLNPGERIELRRAIARTLGQQSWSDVDLILDEFGLPVAAQWEGDPESYVLEMTRRGTDETLAQLNSYLHRTAVAAAPPQTGAFDDPASPRVGTGLRLFVSHHHELAAQAAALREELGKRSIDAFVARDSIDPTEEWEEVILAALPSCDACLALLTQSFSGSKWCDQEIGFWMARDRLVIPVEAGVNPYGFLGRYQALPVKKGLTAVELSVAVSGSSRARSRVGSRWPERSFSDGPPRTRTPRLARTSGS